MENVIQEYEQKILILITENEKLAQVNQERVQELEELKLKYNALERSKAEELESLKANYESKMRFEIVTLDRHYLANNT